MAHKKSGKQLDRDIAAALRSHAAKKRAVSKITDAELMKRLEVRAYPSGEDTMYLEWFALPRELRGKVQTGQDRIKIVERTRVKA